MYTYQDLLKVLEKNSDTETIKFVRDVIVKHEGSDDFKTARDARKYFEHQNVTIKNCFIPSQVKQFLIIILLTLKWQADFSTGSLLRKINTF